MTLAYTLVDLSYRLEESHRYRRVKRFFHDLLENPRSPWRTPFDVAMMVLVLSSVALLIYGVKNPLPAWAVWYERFVVTVFVLEYLLRLWVYNDTHRIIMDHYERAEFLGRPFRLGPALREALRKKWDYVRQPLAIIDLLAILPDYRSVRLLRIFLLFRLFKLMRYTRSVNEFAGVLGQKRTELLTLAIFLAFVIFASATAIYLFEVEAEGSHIHSLFDGVYWALVTLTTVGYGDIVPHTPQGRMVAMVLIITGIGVISFFTSLIVSAFSEKLPEVNAQRVFNEVERRPHHTILCGFGRIGQVVARNLHAARERFVVVDTSAERVQVAKSLGYLALHGNPQENALLDRLNIQGADRILSLTGDDVANVYITLSARQLNPRIEIIARANHRENKIKLQRAGADHTVAPYETAGQVAAQFVGQPVAFEAFYGLLTDEAQIGADAVRIGAESDLVGQPLAALDFAGNRLILFGVVREAGHPPAQGPRSYRLRERQFYFNPPTDFLLEDEDLLIVFGHEHSIAHFKERYALRGPRRRERGRRTA